MEHQPPTPRPFSAQLWTRGHIHLAASGLSLHLFALSIALQTAHWIWVVIGLLTVDLFLFFFYRETLRRARRFTNMRSIQQRIEYRVTGVLVWRRSISSFIGTDKVTGQDIVVEPPVPPLLAMFVVELLILIALLFDWVTVCSYSWKGAGVIGNVLMTAVAIGLTGASVHFIGCIMRDRTSSRRLSL